MKLLTAAVTGITVEGDRLRVRFTNPTDPGVIFDMLAKDVPDELKIRKVYEVHLLEPAADPKPVAPAAATDEAATGTIDAATISAGPFVAS